MGVNQHLIVVPIAVFVNFCFLFALSLLFPFVSDKDAKTLKKIILPSKRLAMHSFAGQNTQDLFFRKLPSQETIAMGWGRRNNDPNDRGNLTNTGAFSSILQQLIVPQVPIQKCKLFPSFQNINEKKQICAGGEQGIYVTSFSSIFRQSSVKNTY